jgi:alpha-beta hydrolase superfamily lysophospholipase
MLVRRRLAALLATPFLLMTALSPVPVAAGATTTYQGSLSDGSQYLIEVPSPLTGWNGTLVLYSHGYVTPGEPNPAKDAGDAITKGWLLANGYAIAGSNYLHTGFAVQEAIVDQNLTLQKFDSLVGEPTRTIAWGHSLGGLITTKLIETYPTEFNGALPMCGVNGGPITAFNPGLDAILALKTLLAPASTIHLVNIPSIGAALADLNAEEGILGSSQATAAGRARTALIAALGDVPGWFSSTSPQPAANAYTTQEGNQYLWLANVGIPAGTVSRWELEQRAGGNYSWTTDVNFADQLEKSIDFKEDKALYTAANLNLDADLDKLQSQPEIAAKASAVAYGKSITPTGDIGIPVLTMHTEGDGYVINQQERVYSNLVDKAGDENLLRQTYVHRAGHCAFTPAEQIEAFKTLIHRLDSGHWGDANNPEGLNDAAAALGPLYNVTLAGPTPPAFHTFHPSVPLRPQLSPS